MGKAAIAPLEQSDVAALAQLLGAQRPEYIRYFRPFDFDETTLANVIRAAVRDKLWALRWEGVLAGFFMLRGFDEGYERPSFGVFVAEEFAGRGLARLALAESLRWGREHGCERLMLKVSPENPRARALYEATGFLDTGQRDRWGDWIMEVSLR